MNRTGTNGKASGQSLALDTKGRDDPSEELLDGPAKASVEVLSAYLSAGNRLRVLKDGTETLPAMFAAIRAARRYVHLEYYVVENVHFRGESLSELLIKKCKSGVQIAIIFDAVGSSQTQSKFFAELQKHGVQLLCFNPGDPRRWRTRYSLNCRDHRKILIADGVLAIVGGINLSCAYETPQDRPLTTTDATVCTSLRRWRDTDLQVEGPAVGHLQRLFLEHWVSHGRAALEDRGFNPPLAPQGPESVAIVGSSPQGAGTHFSDVLLTALRAARDRVWITAGYFLPTTALMRELAYAASRGVDVKLLLPSHNDSVSALAVQRSTYSRLLAAGVEIRERSTVILHAKCAVIDRSWSCVGSSNIDARSMRYNDEVDAIVLGSQTAESLARLFLDDVAKARSVEPAAWRSRPVTQKLREAFWRPWQGFL